MTYVEIELDGAYPIAYGSMTDQKILLSIVQAYEAELIGEINKFDHGFKYVKPIKRGLFERVKERRRGGINARNN